MTSAALTEAQQRVLDAIKTYIAEHGFPPTRSEIMRACGLKALNGVTIHLQTLHMKGAIELTASTARGIKVMPNA